MLYDPKWEVKTGRPTVADFIAWLQTKNPDEEYDWGNCGRCAIKQYILARGFGAEGDYWHLAQTLGMEHRARQEPWTFGALLERAAR